jgi:opacity protein-like surface antigen
MKKRLINILLVIFLPAAGYSQLTHVGLQAAYSTQVKEPGFGIHVIYRVNDDIKITPNALYYLPHEDNDAADSPKYAWISVNLDGNYVVIDQGIFEGYGIMGLNFVHIKGEQEIAGTPPTTDVDSWDKLGLNIGAGIRFNLGDRIVPFGEVRYTVGSKINFSSNKEISSSQFGVYAGILVRILEDKDRSATEDDF